MHAATLCTGTIQYPLYRCARILSTLLKLLRRWLTRNRGNKTSNLLASGIETNRIMRHQSNQNASLAVKFCSKRVQLGMALGPSVVPHRMTPLFIPLTYYTEYQYAL